MQLAETAEMLEAAELNLRVLSKAADLMRTLGHTAEPRPCNRHHLGSLL